MLRELYVRLFLIGRFPAPSAAWDTHYVVLLLFVTKEINIINLDRNKGKESFLEYFKNLMIERGSSQNWATQAQRQYPSA